jgi:spermidine synthase
VLTIYAIMLGSGLFGTMNTRTLYLSRNFFGTLRVVRESDTQTALMHGTTTHGRQSTDPDLHCEPLSYYHRKGPLGSVFATFHALPNSTNVAIVGLGVGTTAAYARPNEHWTFYEINPTVVDLARNSEYFSYLRDCAQAPVDVVLGDARLQLRKAPNAHYGVIVIDAFTSDSIPVHLLTQEAVDVYLSKLAAGGLLAFHISNRHLNLGPVLDGIARSRDLSALDIDDDTFGEFAGKDMSRWVVLTRSPADQGSLPDLPTAKVLNGAGGPVWTDSFSNIVSVFDWH